MWASAPVYTARPRGRLSLGAGQLKAGMPDPLVIAPPASRDHGWCRGSGEHGRSDDLQVQDVARRVGWPLDEWHVVCNTGAVDEHRELRACAHVRNHGDAFVASVIGDLGPNLNVRQCGAEFDEPIRATVYHHEVASVCAEPPREGSADARGCPGDKCTTRAASAAMGQCSGEVPLVGARLSESAVDVQMGGPSSAALRQCRAWSARQARAGKRSDFRPCPRPGRGSTGIHDVGVCTRRLTRLRLRRAAGELRAAMEFPSTVIRRCGRWPPRQWRRAGQANVARSGIDHAGRVAGRCLAMDAGCCSDVGGGSRGGRIGGRVNVDAH